MSIKVAGTSAIQCYVEMLIMTCLGRTCVTDNASVSRH